MMVDEKSIIVTIEVCNRVRMMKVSFLGVGRARTVLAATHLLLCA
jgi:hypothetical protein